MTKIPISTSLKSRKNENLITTFQQPKLNNQTQMSITTSPQNRNVHKISTQIMVTKIMQMTVPCPQALNLKNYPRCQAVKS